MTVQSLVLLGSDLQIPSQPQFYLFDCFIVWGRLFRHTILSGDFPLKTAAILSLGVDAVSLQAYHSFYSKVAWAGDLGQSSAINRQSRVPQRDAVAHDERSYIQTDQNGSVPLLSVTCLSSQILDELANAVEAIDPDKVILLSRTAVEKNIDRR